MASLYCKPYPRAEILAFFDSVSDELSKPRHALPTQEDMQTFIDCVPCSDGTEMIARNLILLAPTAPSEVIAAAMSIGFILGRAFQNKVVMKAMLGEESDPT